MTDLALDRPVPAGTLAVADGVVVAVLPQERLTLVQASSAAGAHLAHLQPGRPNRVTTGPGFRALWLRPGAWLLVGEADRPVAPPPPAGSLRLIDVSHAWVGFHLAGRLARDLLARGTPLDLRPRAFAAGQCARTWCAGFTILVEAADDALVVRVDVSLAASFADWLRDAAAGLERAE